MGVKFTWFWLLEVVDHLEYWSVGLSTITFFG